MSAIAVKIFSKVLLINTLRALFFCAFALRAFFFTVTINCGIFLTINVKLVSSGVKVELQSVLGWLPSNVLFCAVSSSLTGVRALNS
ncbi:hypothetical protein BKA61DRAFT_605406 [Leptodontidium sp. MPI-SDFR-AT-0119]|nr:hypothetical protein BKA61DRAFT_605406 [Leptodontidium sp. MPI-SDFR-AT-0119]